MKCTIITIVSSIVCAGAVFLLMGNRIEQQKEASTHETLSMITESVEKSLGDVSERIGSKLQALADVLATDKDFALRILVENDRTSPSITEMAAHYRNPMGFSVLDITDSSFTILSSGHFTAQAGNSAEQKAAVLSDHASAYTENIMGNPTLTYQAKTGFTIEGFRFYVMGGVTIDSMLLEQLKPNEKTGLLLKRGDRYIGMADIRSISEVTENSIIINDKTYPAATLSVPGSGSEEELKLIVLLKD